MPLDIAEFSSTGLATQEFGPGDALITEGSPNARILLIKTGWALRYKQLRDGLRQVCNVLLPGDIVGLEMLRPHRSTSTVETVTSVSAYVFSLRDFERMRAAEPQLIGELLSSSMRLQSMLLEHVARIGRRNASSRMAHLLLELEHRLRRLGLVEGDSFDLPLNQSMLADLLGLSEVHVNRTLQRLRKDGYLRTRRKRITITDRDALQRLAGFDPAYLDGITA